MNSALLVDLLLCLLLVGVGWSAVMAPQLFTGIVLFIIYGLFVAMSWVRLGAVNVALAEAAIGAGLTGVLLLRAAGRLGADADGTAGPDRPSWYRLGPALAGFVMVAGLSFLILTMPDAGSGLAHAVERNLGASGLGNPVTAVLLDFRGYDTLLEVMVLFAALLSVWSLTPDPLWGRSPGFPEHARPDGVLATFGRVLPPVGLLVGIHLFWAGADAPGGAFQAATVLAAVWMLVLMSGAASSPPMSSPSLRATLVVGPAVFIGIAAIGLSSGTFLAYPPGYAKTLILTIEATLTLSLAATLALLVMGPPRELP